MGAQILAPKKRNILFFTLIVSIADYDSSILILSKVYFQVSKHILPIVNHWIETSEYVKDPI